jgi:hypothetical protein
MPKIENKEDHQLSKYLIPPCIALPFNLTILKNHESGNCIAVTEDGECPHARRRFHQPDKFKCDKNTLLPIDSKRLATQ